MKKFIVFGATLFMLFACNDKAEDTIEDEAEDKPATETKVETVNQVIKEAGDLKIGFFYIDSVMEQFDYALNLRNDVEKKVKAIDDRLIGKQRSFQKWAEGIQSQQQRGLLTSIQLQEAEVEMQRKSESLQREQAEAQQTASTLQYQMESDIMVLIRRFVLEYAEENNYDILSPKTAADPGYFKPSLNLTSVIATGLNAQDNK